MERRTSKEHGPQGIRNIYSSFLSLLDSLLKGPYCLMIVTQDELWLTPRFLPAKSIILSQTTDLSVTILLGLY